MSRKRPTPKRSLVAPRVRSASRNEPAIQLKSLEGEFEGSLHHARRCNTSRRNLPSVATRWIVARNTKAGMIESIKHLPAELDGILFVELPILVDANISGIGPGRLKDISSGVAKRSRRIYRESTRIEILIQPMRFPSLMNLI